MINLLDRIDRIVAYLRRTPECREYYVKVYSGGIPTDYGFEPRYTISVNYTNEDHSNSCNEFVCYLNEKHDDIVNVAIYGTRLREIYHEIHNIGKLWGIEVTNCDWETDYIDVYFDLSNCWQEELPLPEDYHIANLYTFELIEDKYKSLHNDISEEELELKWRGYCEQWDVNKESYPSESMINAISYPQIGIELSPQEYTYYKNNGYNLKRINAWCMSGISAHDYMRYWIPSAGFSSDAPIEEISFSMDLGDNVPRAGFYKLIRREKRNSNSRYDTLVCYYTRSRSLEFVEEEVEINEEPLFNKFSSNGPKNHRLQIGQILHVCRTELTQYLYNGKVTKAYSIDWTLLYEKRLPATYVGPMKHATNTDHPGIKAILSRLYYRAIQYAMTDENNLSENEICFVDYNAEKDLTIPQKELEKQIFEYNRGQLETLRQYLSTISYIDSETKDIIKDLCKKSPIIAPYIVRHRHTARFSVHPIEFYKCERNGDVYRYYFNIFDYSISSQHCAYAELIIEGPVLGEFAIHYTKPCANEYLTEIFII